MIVRSFRSLSAPLRGRFLLLFVYGIALAINVYIAVWRGLHRVLAIAPRELFAGSLPILKATVTKSISILSFIRCSREAGNTSRVRALRARVRARFACARGRALRVVWEQGFSLATMCAGPRGIAALLPLFAMITPQFAFFFAPGIGGPLESCAAFPMFVALF